MLKMSESGDNSIVVSGRNENDFYGTFKLSHA